jgi:hypothetical protein
MFNNNYEIHVSKFTKKRYRLNNKILKEFEREGK